MIPKEHAFAFLVGYFFQIGTITFPIPPQSKVEYFAAFNILLSAEIETAKAIRMGLKLCLHRMYSIFLDMFNITHFLLLIHPNQYQELRPILRQYQFWDFLYLHFQVLQECGKKYPLFLLNLLGLSLSLFLFLLSFLKTPNCHLDLYLYTMYYNT